MPVKLINRALLGIDRAVDAIGAVALISITLIVFLNAMGRYLFSFTVTGAEELARLLMIHLCFLGAYALLRRDGHVNVDVLTLLLTPRMQRVLRGLVGLVAAVLMAYLAWLSWQLVAFSAATGQRAPTLPVPRYFFFLPIAVASTLMTLAGLDKLVRAMTGTLPPLPRSIDTQTAVDADAVAQPRTDDAGRGAR